MMPADLSAALARPVRNTASRICPKGDTQLAVPSGCQARCHNEVTEAASFAQVHVSACATPRDTPGIPAVLFLNGLKLRSSCIDRIIYHKTYYLDCALRRMGMPNGQFPVLFGFRLTLPRLLRTSTFYWPSLLNWPL